MLREIIRKVITAIETKKPKPRSQEEILMVITSSLAEDEAQAVLSATISDVCDELTVEDVIDIINLADA